MDECTQHLKIKVKNHTDEAQLIRVEERKTHGMEKWNLQQHRKGHLRECARKNHLVYNALLGTPYEKVEQKCDELPNFKEVKKIVIRFGGDEELYAEWKFAAHNHLREQGHTKCSGQPQKPGS